VHGFDDGRWIEVARDRSYQGILEKFRQNEDIRTLLVVDTGNRGLVEASPHDRRWGVGYDALDAPENKDRWGSNWLGQSLMRVRDEIRTGERRPWSHYEDWRY
jgi:ribA/ribD-fused uncharacterized protein